MPKNGEENTQFGLYRSLCCDRELAIREGETFPDCPRHTNLGTVSKLIEVEIIEMKTIKKNDNSASAG
jgi:hypothetical protein